MPYRGAGHPPVQRTQTVQASAVLIVVLGGRKLRVHGQGSRSLDEARRAPAQGSFPPPVTLRVTRPAQATALPAPPGGTDGGCERRRRRDEREDHGEGPAIHLAHPTSRTLATAQPFREGWAQCWVLQVPKGRTAARRRFLRHVHSRCSVAEAVLTRFSWGGRITDPSRPAPQQGEAASGQ